MLSIGFAAGIFKPLIAGTVRAHDRPTNKTLGFGIFYAMVNVGGSFGPIVAGKLRAISWDYAFLSSAIAVGVMFVITIFFYKEPPRARSWSAAGEEAPRHPDDAVRREVRVVPGAARRVLLASVLGLLQPVRALRRQRTRHRAALPGLDAGLSWIPVLGPWIVGLVSHDVDGVRRVLGESISHTGYIIMILQLPVSVVFETLPRDARRSSSGSAVAAVGFARHRPRRDRSPPRWSSSGSSSSRSAR